MSRRKGVPMMSERTLRQWITGALLVFCVWVFVALGEAHCSERNVVKPAAIYLSLAAADYGSTAYALDNGMAETNPLMRTHAVPKQLAAAALLTFADVKLQKAGHQGRARALRIAVTVIRITAVAINVNSARRAK